MDSIQIGDVVVQQDAHGRYSLNDFHRAAGGEARHQPAQFLRIGPTQALIRELEKERAGHSALTHSAPLETVNGGPERGTYACKELVYAYAMWVSPAFHLRVIRVFDAYAHGRLVPAAPAHAFPVPKSLPEALRLAADLAEQNERQAEQLAEKQRLLEEQRPDYELAKRYLNTRNLVSLSTMVRNLRLPYRDFFTWLERDKVCFKESEDGPWIPYASFRDRGLLVFQLRVPKRQPTEGEVKSFGQTLVTAEGVKWFAQKYGHLSIPIGEQMPLLPESTGGKP